MRNYITTFVLLIGTFMAAQSYTGEGDQKVQLGFTPYGYGTGLKGTYDYGLNDYVSVGGGLEVFLNEPGNKDRKIYGFGRANLHFGELIGLPNEMDLYGGLDLGIHARDIGIGVYAGFRFFPFNETWGLFAELGSRGSLGVSYNF